MVTLADIVDKAGTINKFAQCFSYKIPVQICNYQYGESSQLHLVVEQPSIKASEHARFPLEVVLSRFLACRVIVLDKALVKPVYKNGLKSSATLSDRKGVFSLFPSGSKHVFKQYLPTLADDNEFQRMQASLLKHYLSAELFALIQDEESEDEIEDISRETAVEKRSYDSLFNLSSKFTEKDNHSSAHVENKTIVIIEDIFKQPDKLKKALSQLSPDSFQAVYEAYQRKADNNTHYLSGELTQNKESNGGGKAIEDSAEERQIGEQRFEPVFTPSPSFESYPDEEGKGADLGSENDLADPAIISMLEQPDILKDALLSLPFSTLQAIHQVYQSVMNVADNSSSPKCQKTA